ncbi:MAG TPA: sulfur carrier protein ThiS [Haliangiales bacterium]|nr:sulfur carrier protein ThiS [Haliangiales bacterium]
MIEVVVNGKAQELPEGTTVAGLCVRLGVERTRVAVERNQDVVPRKAYDEVTLEAGDRVEVVAFVGGG